MKTFDDFIVEELVWRDGERERQQDNLAIDDLEKVKKTDEQIISKLLEDTKANKLRWYFVGEERAIEYLYTKVRKEVTIKGDKTIISTIFKIADQLIEDDEQYSEFQEDIFAQVNLITLDVLFNKNNKKDIFCKRILGHQLKLSELVALVLPIAVKKPEKK